MRTSALRLSVGAYSDGTWHVSTVVDHYERGVLVHSEVEVVKHVRGEAELEHEVTDQLAGITAWERQRVGAA